MIFPRSLIIALVSAPFAVFAQSSANPFTNSVYNITAGQPFTFTWTPTSSGTVSLVLRSGSASNLDAGNVIAKSISNSGSYTWSVPSNEVRGSDYAVEIVDDTDPTNQSKNNYTPQFVLDSTNTVGTPTLSSVSLGAPTSSLSLSSAGTTASPSAFPLQSGITLDTSAHHTGTTGTHSGSSSSASMTGSSSSMSSGASSHASTMMTSTQAGALTTGSSSTHTGGAARATAMVGMLGAVALGALAL